MDDNGIDLPQPRHWLRRTVSWAGRLSKSVNCMDGWVMALYGWLGRFQNASQWLTVLARFLSEALISPVQDGNSVPGRGALRLWLSKKPISAQEPRTEAVRDQ